ncbi:MAG: hypothetical protein CVU55_10750 [Deltaproteobacteria bacterium HGW-Deltaproteobacteria-13]|nr:MAG: hypothetical protein CVU55_10750 [Deltaproteobacteria bacterium HGW-Deltaproteobacteria-13]
MSLITDWKKTYWASISICFYRLIVEKEQWRANFRKYQLTSYVRQTRRMHAEDFMIIVTRRD